MKEWGAPVMKSDAEKDIFVPPNSGRIDKVNPVSYTPG